MARKAQLAMGQRHLDEGVQTIRNNQHRIQQGVTDAGMGRTMAGGAAMGAIPAMAAGRMTRDE